MKCNQSGPGFELVSPCPFPTTITITPRAPPFFCNNQQKQQQKNSDFSFSWSSCLTKHEEPNLPYYLPITGGRIIGFISFLCRIVDFAVPADHRVKMKESEKKDVYFDLARELKKLWNMKVTVIPIVIGAFVTVTKGLVQRLAYLEIRGRVETIQNRRFLRSARVQETWGDLLSLKYQWETIS